MLYNHYISSFLAFCIFLTSINHWRHPIKGIRRDIDRVTVIVALITQTIILRNQPNFEKYLIITSTGILFYPLKIVLKNNNKIWLSVFSHSMLHLLGNVASIILYKN
jgi:hypothetical protein